MRTDGKTRSFEQPVHWNRIPIWWKKESSSHALLPLLTFSDDNGALSHTIKLLKVQNTCSLLLIVDSAMETHVLIMKQKSIQVAKQTVL